MSGRHTKLCIVLLNYKTPDMLIDCLESLLEEARTLSAKVVVVDNRSEDDSLPRISDWITRRAAADVVELVASDYNGGFSFGNNLGISHIDADLYLLLNSDTIIRKDAIATLVQHALDYPEVGLVSPRLEWLDSEPQESCFRYYRPISQLLRASSTGLIKRIFPAAEVALRVVDVDSEPEWTSFACVLIRKEVMDQIGLLDQEYFMYFEDIDYCYRARQAGWTIRNCIDARVVHLRGGSSPVKENQSQRKRQARYYYESRTRYFFKTYGWFGLLAANVLWSAGWLIAMVRSGLQQSFQSTTCESEWRDIWINFLSPKKPFVHPENYK